MAFPKKCHPHYCPFDSPACPEQCSSLCQRIKPNCVSVTAQQAMNMPERKIPRSKSGIPEIGCSTRERIFGIPYDPRKDFSMPTPKDCVDEYLQKNYHDITDRVLKEYAEDTCCATECNCSLGSRCLCQQQDAQCKQLNN
ncbi:uncharacterized protein LOC118184680 [Stegodyphus dumicola]|uniref:uncharacterized protein LOC118184680 n=1 Tax=Stegodyphus dumicola TaxID=202533 RepID=UPI0015AE1B38|nr:uncharacterized protein LOC118184680 [Stegodyphus dumicola]